MSAYARKITLRLYALSSDFQIGECVDDFQWGSFGPALSKRRSKLPPITAFGSVLRLLRDARRLSTGQVENALKASGTQLGRSTVTQYEKGQVWSPDPVVLAEMARIYRSDLAGLIATLKANRQNPSLSLEQADAIRKGASSAGAATVGVLQDERDEAVAAVREMRELASKIIGIAAGHAAGEEGRLPGATESGGSAANRTTHR